jgi:hypothetical protein
MADVQAILKVIGRLDQKVDDLYRRENHGEANVPTTDDFSRKGLRKDHETLQKSIDDLAKQVNELKPRWAPTSSRSLRNWGGQMALPGLDKDQAPPAAMAKAMLEEIHGTWWNVYIGGPGRSTAARSWTPNVVKGMWPTGSPVPAHLRRPPDQGGSGPHHQQWQARRRRGLPDRQTVRLRRRDPDLL